MSKEIDILDLLPSEVIEAVDKLGYEFLAGYGYDIDGVIESEYKREELRKALDDKGEELVYVGQINDESGAILVWYELRSNGDRIATSRGIKFLPQKEETDGKNRTD